LWLLARGKLAKDIAETTSSTASRTFADRETLQCRGTGGHGQRAADDLMARPPLLSAAGAGKSCGRRWAGPPPTAAPTPTARPPTEARTGAAGRWPPGWPSGWDVPGRSSAAGTTCSGSSRAGRRRDHSTRWLTPNSKRGSKKAPAIGNGGGRRLPLGARRAVG